jgi:hypothetical protein
MLDLSDPVPGLAAGVCEVHWTAISTYDGHVTKGVFSFSVNSHTSHERDRMRRWVELCVRFVFSSSAWLLVHAARVFVDEDARCPAKPTQRKVF